MNRNNQLTSLLDMNDVNNQLTFMPSNNYSNDKASLMNFAWGYLEFNLGDEGSSDLHVSRPVISEDGYSDASLLRAFNESDDTLEDRNTFLVPLRNMIANYELAAYSASCRVLVSNILNTLPREDNAEMRSILLRIATGIDETACLQAFNLIVYGAPAVDYSSYSNVAKMLLLRVPDEIPEIIKPFNERSTNPFIWVSQLLPDSIKQAIQQSIVTTIQFNPATTTALCLALVSGSAITLGVNPYLIAAKGTYAVYDFCADQQLTEYGTTGGSRNSISWHIQAITSIIRTAWMGR
jgi:hypothetical protein